MSKAIDSGMSNIANYSKVYSSSSDIVPTSKNENKILDNIEDLLSNIRRDHKDFDLESWIDCNNLKGKSEREIFISLSEKYTINMIGNRKCVDSINKIAPIIKETLSNQGYPTDSLSDFFYEVKQTIIVGKNDYLDVLKSIFSNYMDYVRDLRTAITSISQYTKAGKKDGYISINFVKFYYELNEVKKKYININSEKSFFYTKLLYQHKNDENYFRQIDKQDINFKNINQVKQSINSVERILKEIKGINIIKTESNIPLHILNYKDEKKNNISSKTSKDIMVEFIGNIDFAELDHFMKSFDIYLLSAGILLKNDLDREKERLIEKNNIRKKEINDQIKAGIVFESIQPYINVEAEMDKMIKENNNKIKGNVIFHNNFQTEFDLFKKSLDALEKKMNTNLDELSKKYSSANSNYDNFVKIVSSTMNSLLEMAKGFLRF